MKDILEQLDEYTVDQIYFLKRKWREWINNGEEEKFVTIDGKPPVSHVEKLVERKKIVAVRKGKRGFHEAVLQYSRQEEILVYFQLHEDRVAVITYYARRRRRK